MRLLRKRPGSARHAIPGARTRRGALRVRPHGVAGRLFVMALIVLSVGLWASAVGAKASYSYSEDPIRAGNKALDDMRLDDAKAMFDQALKDNYQVPKAQFGLAEVMIRSGRLEDAEKLLREAIDTQQKEGGKPFAEAHAWLGIVLIDTDRWDEGAKEIHSAYQLDSGYWPAIYGEARLLLQKHKWDDAEALLRKGEKKKGVSEGEDLYHHGMALLYLGTNELTMAETEALSAFHMNPSYPRHGRLVAQIYERRNVPALAIAACEEVLQTPGVTPTASFVHFMGTLYQKAGRYNEARDSYLKAVEIDSTYTPVLKDWAGLLALAKQYDRAAQIYLRYLDKEPGDIEALVGLSGALYEGGRYSQALETASKAMALDSSRTDVLLAYARAAIKSRDRSMRDRAARIYSDLPDTLHWQSKDKVLLASYQIETNNKETALRTLLDVVHNDSTYADAYFQLGVLSLKANSAKEASDYFDKAIRFDPKVPLYYLNAGVAYFQLKDINKAIPEFRKSVQLDPRLVVGHTLLGQALIAADSISAAETEYKKAADLEPANPAALRGLGYCYLKRGAYQEALGVYKSATETDPKNADAWVGLGQSYLGLGNISGAEGALLQAQAIDPNNASLKGSWELLQKARQRGGG
jgi:tetratricopeptide (TPR) repeat protein